MKLRSMHKVVLALLLGVCVASVAVVPVMAESELAAQQVLRIGTDAGFTTLDPHMTSIVVDHSVIQQVYGSLFRYVWPTGELVPDLCTSYEVSADGLVYVFHLRKGVQWHKGYGEFTAHDVKYSIGRVVDPAAATRFAGEFALVSDVTVLDDYTVQLTLKKPYASLLHKLSSFRQGFIVNRRAVEEFGAEFGRNPIGTGPFVFEEWVPQTRIVLNANPDYYAGAPTLQQLIFLPMGEAATRQMALETGAIDVMEVGDATTYQVLSRDPSITVKRVPSTTYVAIGINTTVKPFTDVRVRQALAYAIDKDAIVEGVLTDVAVRADTLVPPSFPGHTTDLPIYEYNPTLARQLLAQAGYPNGFETSIQYARLSASGTFHEAVIPIQQYWAAVGVKLNLEVVDSATWSKLLGEDGVALSYAGLSRPPDVDMLMVYWDATGSLNFINYDIQDLIDQGRVETDPEARAAIYAEFQRRIATDVPMIPLFYPYQMLAMQTYVQNMGVDLLRGFWAYEVYIAAHE